jgi:hypothetical protein
MRVRSSCRRIHNQPKAQLLGLLVKNTLSDADPTFEKVIWLKC